MPPDYLVIGHIVKDIVSDGWEPGGSVYYAAAQASRLGLKVAAVTSCGPDIDPAALLPGVDWHVASSDVTTTFENRYEAGGRRQRLLQGAPPLQLDDVPQDWRAAPVVFLAPVFHDVDPALPAQLAGKGSLLGLGAQGWLRRRDGEYVLPGRFEAQPSWLAGDAVFVSEEDLDEPESVSLWQERVRTVVLTRADRGCSVWGADGRRDLPAVATQEIDPTGAGDVFAAAFLVRLRETGSTEAAAHFAAAAAALAVREPGIDGIGDRKAIEVLMAQAELAKLR
jgi:sugar/nucleoside kinase (ribokinase family)